ncbi:hypothetical protein BLNAU_6604 [Blattamonas nauphoetae]|uniref:Uncharacterized protein n=1 Tax=Blattamonas nauphoetae TaxID=2049346 RepID=A0ABQ9Y3N6_9EUKA|nr:hypothetical protein BLNAU_6604 [Blattamonas nauphoetae]
MPPKPPLGRNHDTTLYTQQPQCIHSSNSDNHIVPSSKPIRREISNESSLYSPSLPATTDAFTITPNDHKYIQISKQILQSEMKRTRINIGLMSDQAPLKNDTISLPASTTTDWRLVLQDSITANTLRQGCISLFEQVNSGQNLTPIEVTHAVSFLKYASIHTKYSEYPFQKLLEPLLSFEVFGQRKLTSALVKLVAHPSNSLQTVALSLLDVTFSISLKEYFPTLTLTGLMPHLFTNLSPHEIPLDETTIEFHRHLISILDHFFIVSSPQDIPRSLQIDLFFFFDANNFLCENLDSLFKPSLAYLRSLIAPPACSPDTRSGLLLVSRMRLFREFMLSRLSFTSVPEIQRFFEEIRMDIVEELAPMLELFFSSDDKFELKMYGRNFSSSPSNTQSLWTLFTPTQPHHATIVLDAFRRFMSHENRLSVEKHIWSGWFPSFVKAVDPSKLPFTADFIPFHTQLIIMLCGHLQTISHNFFHFSDKCTLTDQLRSELDETYHAFYTHTKDYVVHLSLHPFALDNDGRDVILEYLHRVYLWDCDNSLSKPYREEVRKAMDASALSSSSPPFILTSQLVCRLTDDEIINVVDRIVTLLESDSCLDDDTILRICAFHKHKLHYVRLSDLFRKAGRSTEQYFHALECLLSLPINYLDRSPINYLLSSRSLSIHPTSDEWDDIHLETVGIVKRMIDQNQLSVASNSKQFDQFLRNFVFEILPQSRSSAARLRQSQFERLFAPSVDILGQFFIHPPNSKEGHEERRVNFYEHTRTFDRDQRDVRAKMFLSVCKLCTQPAIARCLNRTGFFSRFVTAMFDLNFDACDFIFKMIVDRQIYPEFDVDDQNTIRRTIPNLLEEGWQDVLEFVYVKKAVVATIHIPSKIKPMMRFFGGNVSGPHG